MTREEAITYLEDAKHNLPYKFGQALNMAIEALQTEPILCKECQHWESGHCRQFGRDIPMNAYCSYALPNVDERREP